MTTGELVFWIGIAGMCAVLVISIIVALVMSKSRKRLLKKLSEEYGEIHKDK